MNIHYHLLSTTDGETSALEETYAGEHKALGAHTLLTYEEAEYGDRTQVKLSPDGVTVVRRGKMEMTLRFAPYYHHRTTCLTPMGRLEMGVHTSELRISASPLGGEMQIVYAMYINGQHASDNRLALTWNL